MTNAAPTTRDRYNLSWRIKTASKVAKTGTKLKNIPALVGPILSIPS